MSKLAFRIRKECFKQILLCRSSACAPCVVSSSIFMSFPIFLGRYAKLLFKYFTLFCSLLKFKCLKNIFWRFCAKIKLTWRSLDHKDVPIYPPVIGHLSEILLSYWLKMASHPFLEISLTQ